MGKIKDTMLYNLCLFGRVYGIKHKLRINMDKVVKVKVTTLRSIVKVA